jgi:acetylornithine deacetylase/succinyl-diaminopimelate desuccinylase-like protein
MHGARLTSSAGELRAFLQLVGLGFPEMRFRKSRAVQADGSSSIAQLQAAVKAVCPKGVTAELKLLSAGAPSLTDPDNAYIHAAAEAMKQIFGKETVYIRSGGSIPIVGVFDKYLGVPSVMMGFGLPDDNLHAPNEKFHLPNFCRGIETVARYLEILA